MTRTRVVKGIYTKITKGDHHMFAQGNIVTSAGETINQLGTEKGVSHGQPAQIKNNDEKDFNITFSLNKDEKTVVALGVVDFDNKYENPYFAFNYSLSLSNIDSLDFQIKDAEGKVIYQMKNLAPVVITALKKPVIYRQISFNLPVAPVKTWDYSKVFNQYNLSSGDYTRVGTYIIYWDGFDNDEVFDSSRFNKKTLKAKITAAKDGKEKSMEIDFSTEYSQVSWTDVKIDRKKKEIYNTLRVELEDGGEAGLKCRTVDVDPDPKINVPSTQCPWDKIPEQTIAAANRPPLKARTKSFTDLENLSIEGLNYHWSRNDKHAIAKELKVNGDSYKTFMKAVSTKENAVGAMKLVYNTNGSWMRSGNPGSVKDPLSAAGKVISRQAICYNAGYIYSQEWYEFYKSKDWRYRLDSTEEIVFKETAAHEIGHEILKKYGGTIYSYGHKGTVNPVLQNENSKATKYPESGEIDLMPYYTNFVPYAERKRMAAAEKDVLGLIWLTKIKIK